jgi:hypothetical protein
MFSSLNVRDQVPHPYKIAGKTIFLYITILNVLEANDKINGSGLNRSKYYQNSVLS